MTKTWLIAVIVFSTAINASSQTLFTYGKYSADAKDFIRAYNKNNTDPSAGKQEAMRKYLDLYINSRLKIQEAYERRYDTLPQIRSEVETLRNQIMETYMSDPDAITRLTKEAFQRSLKDVHVAQIFISFTNKVGMVDTAAATKKLSDVVERLKKGEDFLKVAAEVSDEPSARANRGDIGYVTVLTLPYVIENIIYSTGPG